MLPEDHYHQNFLRVTTGRASSGIEFLDILQLTIPVFHIWVDGDNWTCSMKGLMDIIHKLAGNSEDREGTSWPTLAEYDFLQENQAAKSVPLEKSRKPSLESDNTWGWIPTAYDMECTRNIYRRLSQALPSPFQEYFKKSLNERILPSDWKRARVSAIYKKGKKSHPGNYRPVSLTINNM